MGMFVVTTRRMRCKKVNVFEKGYCTVHRIFLVFYTNCLVSLSSVLLRWNDALPQPTCLTVTNMSRVVTIGKNVGIPVVLNISDDISNSSTVMYSNDQSC